MVEFTTVCSDHNNCCLCKGMEIERVSAFGIVRSKIAAV